MSSWVFHWLFSQFLYLWNLLQTVRVVLKEFFKLSWSLQLDLGFAPTFQYFSCTLLSFFLCPYEVSDSESALYRRPRKYLQSIRFEFAFSNKPQSNDLVCSDIGCRMCGNFLFTRNTKQEVRGTDWIGKGKILRWSHKFYCVKLVWENKIDRKNFLTKSTSVSY